MWESQPAGLARRSTLIREFIAYTDAAQIPRSSVCACTLSSCVRQGPDRRSGRLWPVIVILLQRTRRQIGGAADAAEQAPEH
eukprot:SAG25_NODE_208_length_11851_cov_12.361896_1_plen_82_part_00